MQPRAAPSSLFKPASKPFDYTAHLEQLIVHIAGACPVFSHVNTRCVLTGWSQSRVGGEHGVFATIQGLRFAGGATTLQRRHNLYRWPTVTYDGNEILYVIYFMLPRFADLPFRSKLTTVFHELYHISPLCNGDLRRFPGRNYAHGHSREAYNARLQPWIDEYLQRPGSAEAAQFLELTFTQIQEGWTGLVGRKLQPLKPMAVK